MTEAPIHVEQLLPDLHHTIHVWRNGNYVSWYVETHLSSIHSMSGSVTVRHMDVEAFIDELIARAERRFRAAPPRNRSVNMWR